MLLYSGYCRLWIAIHCVTDCGVIITVAQRVLKRASESPLKLQGAQLMIQRYIPQSAGKISQVPPPTQQPPDPRRVVVDNIDPGATTEYLTLFFQNEKLSGGGEVDNVYIDHDKGRAVIVFKEEEGKR